MHKSVQPMLSMRGFSFERLAGSLPYRASLLLFGYSMLRLALSVLLILLPTMCFATDDDEVIGRATVIDGDTIEIAGKRIRLDGIDAPESWQTCQRADGKPYQCRKEAALALDDYLSQSRPTTCRSVGYHSYRRVVADCFRADGEVVNQWLVRSGNAVDWPRYSKGEFAGDEKTAKAEGLGIWKGKFELPCKARAAKARKQSKC